jgi:phosphohistidine phosphatase
MRTIYLLRHAKSSWKNEELADFERPLNGRGRKACEVLGRYIKTNQLEFDLVVCSTAVRTRETIDLVRQNAKLQTEVRYDERIYEATASRLLEVVSQLENDRKNVVLVGHNPGMAELLYLLTGEQESFPTACFAKLNLKVSKWSEALENRATVEWIVRPRELEEG